MSKKKPKEKEIDFYYIDEVLEDTSLKTFEIWQEGDNIFGKKILAEFHGTSEGKNFEEACYNYFKHDNKFDPVKLTFFGAKLFPNEADAHKKHG